MAVLKCKMCGAPLNLTEGATVVECEYCGTKQTLSKTQDERIATMFERANQYRLDNEFDKAMSLYEKILLEDSTDAEAYWGLLLSKFGIEYVDDETQHRRVPTINRMQPSSILADSNYLHAVENADAGQRIVYEHDAKEIANIQKGIAEISQKEEPFDVFICYKETDANGRRTRDSVLATELYHELTKEGFKVFFSRITLEDKIGSAYEPYIFAALNSASVMVVLGTKKEYFNAVWTKNEWSRFLALIKQGKEKTLIPAYKDMDPYDLPVEFANLQAQDMGKLGFMQDLIRGVKKIIAGTKEQHSATVTKVTNVSANVNPTLDSLLTRAKIALEDGDFEAANTHLEKALDIDAKCAEAYLGKFLVDLKICKKDDLFYADIDDIEENKNFEHALKYANAELEHELNIYLEQIKKRELLSLDCDFQELTDALVKNNDKLAEQYFSQICEKISTIHENYSGEQCELLGLGRLHKNIIDMYKTFIRLLRQKNIYSVKQQISLMNSVKNGFTSELKLIHEKFPNDEFVVNLLTDLEACIKFNHYFHFTGEYIVFMVVSCMLIFYAISILANICKGTFDVGGFVATLIAFLSLVSILIVSYLMYAMTKKRKCLLPVFVDDE